MDLIPRLIGIREQMECCALNEESILII